MAFIEVIGAVCRRYCNSVIGLQGVAKVLTTEECGCFLRFNTKTGNLVSTTLFARRASSKFTIAGYAFKRYQAQVVSVRILLVMVLAIKTTSNTRGHCSTTSLLLCFTTRQYYSGLIAAFRNGHEGFLGPLWKYGSASPIEYGVESCPFIPTKQEVEGLLLYDVASTIELQTKGYTNYGSVWWRMSCVRLAVRTLRRCDRYEILTT